MFVVTILLLPELAADEIIGWPHFGDVDRRSQNGFQRSIAAEMTCLHHGGHHRQVISSECFALRQRPHTVSNLQSGIPKACNEAFEFLRQRRTGRLAG